MFKNSQNDNANFIPNYTVIRNYNNVNNDVCYLSAKIIKNLVITPCECKFEEDVFIDYISRFSEKYKCPNCGNAFDILVKNEKKLDLDLDSHTTVHIYNINYNIIKQEEYNKINPIIFGNTRFFDLKFLD